MTDVGHAQLTRTHVHGRRRTLRRVHPRHPRPGFPREHPFQKMRKPVAAGEHLIGKARTIEVIADGS